MSPGHDLDVAGFVTKTERLSTCSLRCGAVGHVVLNATYERSEPSGERQDLGVLREREVTVEHGRDTAEPLTPLEDKLIGWHVRVLAAQLVNGDA
jgi:hypothetical protein